MLFSSVGLFFSPLLAASSHGVISAQSLMLDLLFIYSRSIWVYRPHSRSLSLSLSLSYNLYTCYESLSRSLPFLSSSSIFSRVLVLSREARKNHSKAFDLGGASGLFLRSLIFLSFFHSFSLLLLFLLFLISFFSKLLLFFIISI